MRMDEVFDAWKKVLRSGYTPEKYSYMGGTMDKLLQHLKEIGFIDDYRMDGDDFWFTPLYSCLRLNYRYHSCSELEPLMRFDWWCEKCQLAYFSGQVRQPGPVCNECEQPLVEPGEEHACGAVKQWGT
jgi:hypothetical protein